jgi:hypothetical protein
MTLMATAAKATPKETAIKAAVDKAKDIIDEGFKETATKEVAEKGQPPKSVAKKDKVVPLNSDLPVAVKDDLPWTLGGNPVLPYAGFDMTKAKVLTPDEVTSWPTPCVIINNVLIAPTEEGIAAQHGRLGFGMGSSKYIPFYSKGLDAKKYNRYVAVLDGRQVEFLLDELSKVVVSNNYFGNSRYDQLTAQNAQSSLLLINSSSVNDSVIGENYLLNVDSKNNVFNRSSVSATRMFSGPRDYQFTELTEKPERSDLVPRQKFEHCQFKETRVTDSELSPGYYSRSTLTQSRVRSNRTVYVRSCELNKASFDGKAVSLKRVNSVSMSVNAEGEINVSNIKLSNDYMTVRSLYMPNKFSLLTVDFPVQELKMVRTEPAEIELSFFTNDSVRFGLTPSREDVLEGIRDLIKRNNYGHYRNGSGSGIDNAFSESFLDYAADAVMSRLRVIGVLDAATNVVNEMNQNYNDNYDDPYMF